MAPANSLLMVFIKDVQPGTMIYSTARATLQKTMQKTMVAFLIGGR
jgi:hypothetical protein